MTSNRRGLTFVEVVVVLVIVVLLIAMLLPNVRSIRGVAERVKCMNNLKQLMLGLHGYADQHPVARSVDAKPLESFPAGCYGAPGRDPEQRLSWQVCVLPYLEQAHLFGQFDPSQGFSPDSAAALAPLRVLICPQLKRDAEPITTYVGMAGLGEDAARRQKADPANGVMGYDRACAFADIKDGLSNTVGLAETNHALGRWAQGGPGTVRAFDAADELGPDRPLGSAHANGFNVAMCDGSVRFVRYNLDRQVFADAVTVAGGEKSTWE